MVGVGRCLYYYILCGYVVVFVYPRPTAWPVYQWNLPAGNVPLFFSREQNMRIFLISQLLDEGFSSLFFEPCLFCLFSLEFLFL